MKITNKIAYAASESPTTTIHWFAQIGHDLIVNDERDNGEGKMALHAKSEHI